MIYVFSRDLSERWMLAAVESMRWTEKYSSIGTFSVVTGDTDQNAAVLQKGRILHYLGYNGVIAEIIVDNGRITANGYSLTELLNQRTIYNDLTITNAEADFYAAWSANARGMDVETAEAKGFPETVSIPAAGMNFGALAEEICKQSGFGMRVKLDITNGKKIFEFYKGRDLTGADNPEAVVFSTAANTLSGLKIQDDGADFANVAIVRGMDLQNKYVLVIVGDAQGPNRREIFVDASSYKMQDEQKQYDDKGNETGTIPAETLPQYQERLKGMGLEELQKRLSRTNFSATVSSRDYGKRYTLGDIVTCYSKKHNILLSARVSEVRYTIDRDKETTEVTLGEPKITAKELVKLWQK